MEIDLENQNLDLTRSTQASGPGNGRHTLARLASAALLALFLVALPHTVSAQTPQHGTPSADPPVSREAAPPDLSAPQAEAAPDMLDEDEEGDEEGGEGCPYTGNKLELMV